VAEYQHGKIPMEWDTECVNRKLKVVVPSAGLSIPSIFCSTSGPTSVVELLDDDEDQGQPKLTCGRWNVGAEQVERGRQRGEHGPGDDSPEDEADDDDHGGPAHPARDERVPVPPGRPRATRRVISTIVGFCRVFPATRGPALPECPVRSPWTTRPSGRPHGHELVGRVLDGVRGEVGGPAEGPARGLVAST